MNLSIVIPALNEASKISQDIKASAEFIQKNHWTGEIIVVDDGSTDRTTEMAEQTHVPSPIQVNIIRYANQRGKGYALRQGTKASTGDIVLFADSGCCVPLEDSLRSIELIQSYQCDMAHGSRELPESLIQVTKSRYRRFCSQCFIGLIKQTMKLPQNLTDTQCGFKVYRGNVARQLYGLCETDGFMIDLEVIVRACNLGYRIIEFPIHWSCDADSRTNPLCHSLQIFNELRKIKRLC